MAKEISQIENLPGGSFRQRAVVRLVNFKVPYSRPATAPVKKKKSLRISPCDGMMTKYWYNDYVVTHSEIRRLNVETIEQDIHNAEKLLSITSDAIDSASEDNSSTSSVISSDEDASILSNTFRCVMKDTGFSMLCNLGPLDECQGIKASAVVYKTGVTEYWFYRRGLVSTIHYKDI
ncbi:hypothetical protein AGLY_011264 [Aphis glycines]|uniref:Uncharacterized protein n=1 Tax=Aphis glycines TaxID=307491 RepID=A0A6G0TDC4_APHGL|nr:hypothetical protein AGLY_011264 [Aphis glycines]